MAMYGKGKGKGMMKAGSKMAKGKTCPGCPSPRACTAAGKCKKTGKRIA